MEETRKRRAEEDRTSTDSSPRKCRSVSPLKKESEGDGEVGEDIMAWLPIDDETASELLKLLDADSETCGAAATTRVRFIDNPYSRPLIFQYSTSYVTINGNEESCGSSFSYSESSMMASVDARGINISRHLLSGEGKAVGLGSGVEDNGSAWEWNEAEARGWEAVEGCDGIDWDDDMLARFLGE
ncbi:hypothetical protein HS088_TW23G00801 [Tripterygium wilfordii]|uniref:Uncharacterized protein n=1 Tax=Tripterygium wilfordii TaxID=458696 RepID=A0A7J7BW13_TRIWF|nr:uncharacterized protein LOC119992804 [Tripterygium wilfordii]KAF5726061.1 hypothetical protein HS088_TW23G00801 [Tripterygium wilfordii]